MGQFTEGRQGISRRSGGWVLGIAAPILVLLFALPASASGYIAQLKRYPYLTDLVGTSVSVNWGTDRSSISGAVKWGKVGTESCTAHTTPADSVPRRNASTYA